MTTIGNRSVVYATTLLVPDGEVAEVSFSVEAWMFRLRLSFHPDAGAEQSVQSVVEGDALRMRFYRWVNPLGTAYTNFTEVARSPSGRPIDFLIYQHRIGTLNRVDLQFTLGATP